MTPIEVFLVQQELRDAGEDPRDAAHHEAAHVVAALAVGFDVDRADIRLVIAEKGGRSGIANILIPENADRLDATRRTALVSLAGPAAELAIYPERRWSDIRPGNPDIDMVRDWLNPTWWADSGTAEAPTFTTNDTLESYQAEADRFVRAHAAAIARIAQDLLENGELDRAAIVVALAEVEPGLIGSHVSAL